MTSIESRALWFAAQSEAKIASRIAKPVNADTASHGLVTDTWTHEERAWLQDLVASLAKDYGYAV